MEERKGNRKYDKQYKEEAIRLVTEGGRKVTDVARSLGIHESLLRTWKRKYKEDPAGSFPGKGHLKPQDEEFKRLQKENVNLKEDKEILKKALPSSQNTPNEILVYDYRYETRADARQSIFEYIEMFYNRTRRHSALGFKSPVSFELEAMVA